MTQLSQDRLVAKEVSLGQIREIEPPNGYIGTSLLAPLEAVQSDDVIFHYVSPEVEGLAPARAEDAESELAMKDDTVGTGRASIMDWAIKDHYTASDVTRYREYLRLAELSQGQSFPLTVGSMTEDFASKLARDARLRRAKLDNRLEWLAVNGAVEGVITYNDGKIKFSVDYGRPVGQHNQAPSGGTWDLTTSDPIGAIDDMNTFMFDTYGVRMTVGVCSTKVINNILNSDRFAARSGLAGATGSLPIDPKYLIDGWGVEAARAVVQRATGVTLIPYDGWYRTRALGSTTPVINKFMNDKKILFMPARETFSQLSDIGFGKTLTSPHPEGNWSSGYYEWERSTVDPWGLDRGTGIKAFPVFPHLEYTYTMTVLP